jgi:arylsulfatase A-like enzyme
MTPPNLLIILADDQRADTLRYMPNVRNLLQKDGRTFTTCRCNVGVCQATRVSLLTGQTANHNLVYGNSAGDVDPALHADIHTDNIATWLAAVGYRCGLFGKYLNGIFEGLLPEFRQSWATWRQLVTMQEDPVTHLTQAIQPTTYNVYDEGGNTTTPGVYQTQWLAQEVIDFISPPNTEPWFCLVTPTSPMHPYDPHPDDLLAWSDFDWPLVLEDDNPDDPLGVADKPSWIKNRKPTHPIDDPWSAPENVVSMLRAVARGQLREANSVDRLVGDVVRALPHPDNTVIFYGSDNGLSYGEHRAFFYYPESYPDPFYSGKLPTYNNEPYDNVLRVPLVAHGLGLLGFPPGVSVEPVSMAADLTATCVEIAGATEVAEQSHPLDGVDLREVVANPSAYTDRALLHSHHPFGVAKEAVRPPPGNGVTTATRKLWRWELTGTLYNRRTDRYEAYDLDSDPNELSNWANDPVRGERNPDGTPKIGTHLYDLVTALDTLI